MRLETIICGPLDVNCYVIGAENSRECIAIDPADAASVDRYLKENNLHCTYILLTHGHFDHVLGVADLQKEYGAKVLIHKNDAHMLEKEDETAAYFAIDQKTCHADGFVAHKDVLQLAGLSIRVLETPGHTMGSVSYWVEDERVLFTGDTLFRMSVGRTDFPNSSSEAMRESVLNVLLPIEGEISVYPGHMGPSTLDYERKNNPFIEYWKSMTR